MERNEQLSAPPEERSASPSVSVIVPIYNAQRTVEDCLESLLALDYPRDRLQLLCVDNASTDRTPQILARYATRIRVLHEDKRGPAAARNRGLRCATGEVIAFTDSDCVVDRLWLRFLVAPLHDASIGAVGGTILSKRPCNSIERFGEQIHDHERAIHEFMPPYVITMNWSSRLSVLRDVGLFNEELLRSQDVDLSYRLFQAGYTLAYEPRAVIYHQNERTPWGLMHEGYVHGYHAVRVLQLHAAFLQQVRAAGRHGTRSGAAAARRDWNAALWSRLFRFGKTLGRTHASLMATVRGAR